MGEKYRKRPVVIEAVVCQREEVIHTLEGDHLARVGDYIITGVKGERYPCKPDIFALTYEPVETDPTPPAPVEDDAARLQSRIDAAARLLAMAEDELRLYHPRAECRPYINEWLQQPAHRQEAGR